MPYKDPQRRKEFQRLYKAKCLIKQKIISPIRKVRVYFCQRYPGLHVSGAGTFFNSFLITRSMEEQRAVEGHPMFGEHIFCLALNLDIISEDE
jgi:hypothetical protein